MKLLSALTKKLRGAKAGFTMIELLVVITIIAILAVVALSTLNPIEQLNKARDSRTNAEAKELLGAVERYFTGNEIYPWNLATTGYSPSSVDPVSSFSLNSTTGSPNWNWVNNLSSTQEIKDTFASRLRANTSLIVVNPGGANSTTYICYYPKSNSGRVTADKYCVQNRSILPAEVQVLFDANCASTQASPNPMCLP